MSPKFCHTLNPRISNYNKFPQKKEIYVEDIHAFPKQSDQINSCNEKKKVHGLAPVMSKICIKISQ